MIIRYDSIAALRNAYITHVGNAKTISDSADMSWCGNETRADVLRKTECGDMSLVPEAERLMSQLDLQIETQRKVWEPNVAGAFCCVPDVLAGRPTNMRRMMHTVDEANPISIFVDIGSTVSVDAATLRKRGTVILALVTALSRIRPTSLFQLHAGSGKDGQTITASQINTNPLDLATACYVLTSAGFARRLVYGLAEKLNGYDGNWPRGFSTSCQEQYYDGLKPQLVRDPENCLIVPKALINDELLHQPVEWITQQIKRFTQQAEEGADT